MSFTQSNIGVFDRNSILPDGGNLLQVISLSRGAFLIRQADGTSWMAFASIYMLKIALELALEAFSMSLCCVFSSLGEPCL